MSEDTELKELLDSKQKILSTLLRKLYILEERRALYGFDTPPHVVIELEDLQEQVEKLKQEIVELERQVQEAGKPKQDKTPQMVQRKLRVFLCHASQDKPVIRGLYKKLVAEAWIEPWLDEEKLLPGQDWNLEIEKAVEASDAVIVCVSRVAIAKEGYIQRELRKVLDIALDKLEGAIFIIPLRLDDCAHPRQLKDRQFLDYFPAAQQAAAYDKLRASLKIRKDALGI
jgi:chromosome segregation ATPase